MHAHARGSVDSRTLWVITHGVEPGGQSTGLVIEEPVVVDGPATAILLIFSIPAESCAFMSATDTASEKSPPARCAAPPTTTTGDKAVGVGNEFS